MSSVGIVLGTFNRLWVLKRAVASIRQAVKQNTYQIIIVDGGSTDGTREWLELPENKIDILGIYQQGPLTGAVRAFNIGFAHASNHFEYVMHFNDDAELIDEGSIDKALEILKADPKIGEVAFAFDLWTPDSWHFDYINGVPYGNFGVVRAKAGIEVAKAQGDLTGMRWWNPIYHTYAADTEFGVWLWKLGWKVHCAPELRVHDLRVDDALRANNSDEKREKDSTTFWNRWRDENLVQYL